MLYENGLWKRWENWKRFIIICISALIELLFPRCCPVCGDIVLPKGEKICPECLRKLHFIREPVCLRCGKEVISSRQEYCMDCARHPKAFERGMALLNYEEASRRSMAAIKYKNKREYLDFYADCMVSEYGERIRRIAPDALVPVPIHKKRMRERGFNQAEVLAEKMSVKLEIPVCADRLIRRKNTDPQKELSAAERLENLKDAFAVLGSLSHLEKVLLIDDIYTTGATAQACTLALKKAGVRQVFLLTICIGSGEKH